MVFVCTHARALWILESDVVICEASCWDTLWAQIDAHIGAVGLLPLSLDWTLWKSKILSWALHWCCTVSWVVNRIIVTLVEDGRSLKVITLPKRVYEQGIVIPCATVIQVCHVHGEWIICGCVRKDDDLLRISFEFIEHFRGFGADSLILFSSWFIIDGYIDYNK